MSTSGGELKHLGFVKTLILRVVVWLLERYEKGKLNSGPLKSTIGTAENAVTTVVGPVYEKTKGLSENALSFLDKKVGEATSTLDKLTPAPAKNLVTQATNAVQSASLTAQGLMLAAQLGGLRAALLMLIPLAKSFVVESVAVFWYKVNSYTILHVVAKITLPSVGFCSEMYNKIVTMLAAKGFTIFGYFPTVPIDDLKKAYQQVEAAAGKKDDGIGFTLAAE